MKQTRLQYKLSDHLGKPHVELDPKNGSYFDRRRDIVIHIVPKQDGDKALRLFEKQLSRLLKKYGPYDLPIEKYKRNSFERQVAANMLAVRTCGEYIRNHFDPVSNTYQFSFGVLWDIWSRYWCDRSLTMFGRLCYRYINDPTNWGNRRQNVRRDGPRGNFWEWYGNT